MTLKMTSCPARKCFAFSLIDSLRVVGQRSLSKTRIKANLLAP